MGAKFTGGNTGTATVQKGRAIKEPTAKSHYLESGNTMSGMPGYIDAHESEAMDGARGGKGVGPHREGAVGKRGSAGAKGKGKGHSAEGTVTASYHHDSTHSAGTLHDSNAVGGNHVHTKSKGSMPGQKAPPTSKGMVGGGTVQKAGIDMKAHKAKNYEAIITGGKEGHRGRMERLKGHTQTHAEGRRKSVMY